jgi:hypothetical protein
MAETEKRRHQDIGQDEAYVVNLKDVVEATKDLRGRSRLYFDAMAGNMVATMAAINSEIVRCVTAGQTVSEKTAENTIGVNETDQAVRQIINSPWAEALKMLMTAAVAEAQTKK